MAAQTVEEKLHNAIGLVLYELDRSARANSWQIFGRPVPGGPLPPYRDHPNLVLIRQILTEAQELEN